MHFNISTSSRVKLCTIVPTPKHIKNKYCVVNINNDDQKCFLWAVLCAVYTPKYNKERVYNYRPHENKANVDGLSFPLTVKEIPKFEQLNPTISVNVLSLDGGGFVIDYLNPHRGRQHHINLLLLDEQDDDKDANKDEDRDDVDKDGDIDGHVKRHYVWISDMFRLMAARTAHEHKTHVCNSCLHSFRTQRVLDNRMPYCLRHPPQQVIFPNPEIKKERTMKFRSQRKQHYIP